MAEPRGLARLIEPEGLPRGLRQDCLLLITVGAFWGSAFPVIRAGILAGAPSLLFAAVRYGPTAASLVPLAPVSRAGIPEQVRLLGVAAHGGLLIIGLYGVF